ncbi:nicotinamide riboside transporter PnuC [Glycomyces tritici]|uniref:Nicotinamide riboside transporter PnuC n=1 Tax=Glycomyces tritici TaxID=2665176 RepID=A0ABT7YU43_9ACTN|nr:nicotinamide riboside transporter PnuC [Glycomyces tritici]MDN3241788.1 nicotinamide riboside transporter PnuC [Glycomyces tritici]
MNALMEILYLPLFTIAGVPTTLAEGLAFITGALCVWLVARQHVANWGIGIANCLLFILIFTDSGLYADAGLQLVFIALGAYGWWNWVKGGGPADDRLPVSRTDRVEWAGLIGAGCIGWAVIAALLGWFTDSTVAEWDALTTVLSLMATYGQCRKRVESWYLWIAADIVYVPLYAYKGLYLTSILYIGFMALCVLGLRNWRKDLEAQAEPVGAAA